MKEENLNKTIHSFDYLGDHYEIDWLTDATSMPNEMVCDVFMGKGKGAGCVGQIIVKKSDSKKQIEKIAVKEVLTNQQ